MSVEATNKKNQLEAGLSAGRALKTMTAIEEIRQAREQSISAERKVKVLEHLKKQLVNKESTVIWGAPHFRNEVWEIPDHPSSDLKVPYKHHAALSQWLQSLGFRTRRYYNRMGVEQGMEVRI